ncbi:unnamed protein product [Sphagnum balticum]
MGNLGPPHRPGRTGNHRPEGPIRSSLSKTLYQGPDARWRAMERASEAQGQSSKAPSPRARPLHAGYQLDVCSHETQKTSHLLVEEHSPRVDEREAGTLQIKNRPTQLRPSDNLSLGTLLL